MNPHSLSTLWMDGMRALFTGVVVLLALMLRKNQARTRYWLWLAASAKFLIPFSLLAAMGGQLAWSGHTSGAQSGASIAIQQVSRPLMEVSGPIESIVVQPRVSGYPIAPVAAGLTAVWLVGFLAVLGSWVVQWRLLLGAIRAAERMRDGREVEILRRVEETARTAKRMEILCSQEQMEPGVFGVLRPALLWPAGISQHLDDAQLESILAHEVCHVRWRDNLTSLVPMLVEAVFWFHPLVWWMEKQLVKERELACDEEVVRLCHRPQVYAESILKVCEFCIESPLPCVSGITGADLKKRVVQIMTGRVGLKLGAARKLLLLAVALVVVAVPVAFGLYGQTAGKRDYRFEVASIRPAINGGRLTGPPLRSTPGRFRATTSVWGLAYQAFGLKQDYQIECPQWMAKTYFRIDATFPEGATKEDLPIMIRHLLEDRFGLVFHKKTVQRNDGYELIVAKSGPRLTASAGPVSDDSMDTRAGIEMKDGMPQFTKDAGSVQLLTHTMATWRGRDKTMSNLAQDLADWLEAPVIDATGLQGKYDYTLVFTREAKPTSGYEVNPLPLGLAPGAARAEEVPSGYPLLQDALEKQLGLKLQPAKNIPAEVVVLDSAKREPTEN